MIYDRLIERCPLNLQTDTMSYEEWLEKRRGSIGGSDAAPIMGYSDYASRLTLYLQKKGMVEAKEMSVAAKRGKLLEPVIRDWFAESWPEIHAERVPYMFYSPDYPFMSANIDGLLFLEEGRLATIGGKEISGLGGLEIKSSKTGYGFGKDEIPDGYYAQVQHYMAVLGLPWFVLSACFLETEEITNYVIERDEGFIADLVRQEKDFWDNHMVPEVIPAAVGLDAEDDMITGIFEGSRSTIVLGVEETALCSELVELKNQSKTVDKRIEAITADLKAVLVQKATGNPEEKKLSAIAGRYSISWSRFDTRRADSDALKKAGIFEQYSKVSESGRFSVTEKKGA
jgi:putative phage-type endonuclease